MDKILEINVPHVEINDLETIYSCTNTCVCCLTTDGVFVNLLSCSHNEFIKQYLYNELSKMYVCHSCHYMLKKIELFRKQVLHSIEKLQNMHCLNSPKLEISKTRQINNLVQSDIVLFTYNGKPRDYETNESNIFDRNFDSLDESYNINFDTEDPIKAETDTSDIEFDIPLYEISRNNKRQLKENELKSQTQFKLRETNSRLNNKFSNLQRGNKLELATPCENYIKSDLKIHNDCNITTQNELNTQTIEIQQNQRGDVSKDPINQNGECPTKNVKMTLETNEGKLSSGVWNQDGGAETSIKKRKVTLQLNEMYLGKISLYLMNEREIMEEREQSRNNSAYLSLKFKCVDCVKGFTTERKYLSHYTSHHDPKNLNECNICKCTFRTKECLKGHLRRHGKRYQCLACNKRFSVLYPAVAHYNNYHGAKYGFIEVQYTCSLCQYTTECKRQYGYHLEKHRSKNICCKICDKTFTTNSSYQVHLDTIHGVVDTNHQCNICAKRYNSRSALLNHLATKHNEMSRKYCEQCKKFYANKNSFEQHLKKHKNHWNSDDVFICDYCNKRFKYKTQIISHINYEHMKKSYLVCNICAKTYKHQSNLNRHILSVHKNIKPVKNRICDYCGKGFSSNAMLNVHIRTHTGERPLVCSLCDSNFAQPAALYTHKKLVHKIKNNK